METNVKETLLKFLSHAKFAVMNLSISSLKEDFLNSFYENCKEFISLFAPTVIDDTPTEDSENPVSSGGVYTALAGKQPAGSYADGEVYTAPAEGHATINDDKVILGAYPAADTQDAYALIVGNGTDAEHPSIAFAISRTGNLVLFNAGEAVELTPAKLAELIA